MQARALATSLFGAIPLTACLSLGDTESSGNAPDGGDAASIQEGGWGANASDSAAGAGGSGNASGGSAGAPSGGGTTSTGGSAGGVPSTGGTGAIGGTGGSGGALTCAGGKADCNGLPGDDCETDILVDPANCGGCNKPCNLPNATAGCGGGLCAVVGCNAGFGNCDGTPGNGCETGLSTLSNCGACNTACTQAPLNSTPACVAMACSFTCTTGWGNCDSNAANGCETLLLSDGANCGNCGAKCSGVLVCSNGMCKLPG